MSTPHLEAPAGAYAKTVLMPGDPLRPTVGNVLSSDGFYPDVAVTDDWRKMGVMALEMESAALYANAARAGKSALAMFTISDERLNGKTSTPPRRARPPSPP